LHLLADALVVARGEDDFYVVEQAVAGQGDTERSPGRVVSPIQGLRRHPAVVAKVLHNVADDLNDVVALGR
jgi:hypothetical protein